VSTEDCPLSHAMHKIMYKFDELEERILVLLMLLYLMLHILVNRPRLLVNLNMRGCFTMILINMARLILIANLNWPLRHLKLIRTILEG